MQKNKCELKITDTLVKRFTTINSPHTLYAGSGNITCDST